MSIVPTRLLTLILALTLPSYIAYGAVTPPPPPESAPPGPGLPIDDNIYLLIIISVILGIYKMYRFNQIKKASN